MLSVLEVITQNHDISWHLFMFSVNIHSSVIIFIKYVDKMVVIIINTWILT